MTANLFQLDTIANNLANSGTTAFKKSRANFEDLFYEYSKLPGSQGAGGGATPTGIAVGLGTRVKSTQMDFKQGTPMDTGRAFDVAILGDGFFRVSDPVHGDLYTRDGSITTNANGAFVLASADQGRLLEPPINIPPDAIDITITGDGFVSYMQPGSTTLTQQGPITLTKFVNPQGLIQMGEGLYAPSGASGDPIVDNPGQQGLGSLKQGFLESSNVEPVRELVNLIKTQRNFELSSQTVQAADQALQLINNLRRF